MTDNRPVVAVWKSTWLPQSQTFVANQLESMNRWRPLLLGVRRLEDGLPVVPDRAPFGSGRLWRGAHRLSAATGYRGIYDGLIRSSESKVVHAHFGTSAAAVLPIARRHHLPLVVTFHGYDVTSEPIREHAAGLRYVRSLAEVFAYADTLIAVSDYVASRLSQLGAPAQKIRVQYIGIPTSGAPPDPGNRHHGIVFVGRLVERKGVIDLIQAVAALPAEFRSIPVTIVGDGPLRATLERAGDIAGIQVTWRGFLSPVEVTETLRRSTIFCAPSSTATNGDAEAFGMVYLEAALQGLPVVAYSHAGVPEAVQDGVTGLLCPEKDVAALSHNLHSLLEDRERATSLGNSGRARVLREFDIVRQTTKLEELYDQATSRARNG